MRFFPVSILCILLSFSLSGQDNPRGMVLIPEGHFIMGSNGSPTLPSYPAHPVHMESFYMDILEVSNKEYAAFCEASGHRYPEFWGIDVYHSGPEYPDYPVLGVSQFDATEYAKWAGKRLPTEAEWEYAARGGLEGIEYPYGEQADHAHSRYNDPHAEAGPVPCGSFEANDYGLFDMSGNVWEWVSDWFAADYYSSSPESNPPGPSTGNFKVFRGGGWHSGGGCTSVYRRNALPMHWVDIAGGFRCAKDVDGGA